jgi:hypothetical protein
MEKNYMSRCYLLNSVIALQIPADVAKWGNGTFIGLIICIEVIPRWTDTAVLPYNDIAGAASRLILPILAQRPF